MRVFIAEKPSLAQAIFEGLGGNAKTEKKNGYYQHGNEVVTWCYGHMLELFDPQDYDESLGKWNFNDLPIKIVYPPKLKPKKDTKTQLDTILKLIEESNSIVHAGDIDDEGNLLIDEILNYANNQKPVERLLVKDLNLAPVKKALANMQSNELFKGWTNAALVRSLADQAFGYNLTRACTLKGRDKGYQSVLNVGRVQSAVLGLVNIRTLANSNHQESFYYDVYANISIRDHVINAKYQAKDSDQIDEKKRLISEPNANHISKRNIDKEALVTLAMTKPENSKPPLPLNLSTLQQICAKQYGYTAKQTLDIMQSLYENHKLLTYPRSDSRYLTDEIYYQTTEISNAISETMPELADAISKMDIKLKHKAYDDSKVEAHHAIVPTLKSGAGIKLNEQEKNVYHLVSIHFIGLFYPDAIRHKTKVTFDIDGDQFNATQSVLEQRGWEDLHKSSDKKEALPEFDISSLSFNEKGHCESTNIDKKKTTPPKFFTESTLLAAMTKAAKFIDDPELRKALEAKDEGSTDQGSIGTEATRASILERLSQNTALISIEKEKGYKELVWKTTKAGQEFCAALPSEIIKPDISAIWEEKKAKVKTGEMSVEAFILDIDTYIDEQITYLSEHGLNMTDTSVPCPSCGKALIKRTGKNGLFWSCTGYPECSNAYPDKLGKPDFTPRVQPVISQHKCPHCQKGLIRRKSTKGKGKYFWGCSGYPECSVMLFDKKGRPDFDSFKGGEV